MEDEEDCSPSSHLIIARTRIVDHAVDRIPSRAGYSPPASPRRSASRSAGFECRPPGLQRSASTRLQSPGVLAAELATVPLWRDAAEPDQTLWSAPLPPNPLALSGLERSPPPSHGTVCAFFGLSSNFRISACRPDRHAPSAADGHPEKANPVRPTTQLFYPILRRMVQPKPPCSVGRHAKPGFVRIVNPAEATVESSSAAMDGNRGPILSFKRDHEKTSILEELSSC